MVAGRMTRAGGDSLGNTWPPDGAVIDVDPLHAVILASIPDAPFEVIDETAAAVEPAAPGEQSEHADRPDDDPDEVSFPEGWKQPPLALDPDEPPAAPEPVTATTNPPTATKPAGRRGGGRGAT